MWWKDMKMRMCLIIGIIILLIVIIVPSGMLSFPSFSADYSINAPPSRCIQTPLNTRDLAPRMIPCYEQIARA